MWLGMIFQELLIAPLFLLDGGGILAGTGEEFAEAFFGAAGDVEAGGVEGEDEVGSSFAVITLAKCI